MFRLLDFKDRHLNFLIWIPDRQTNIDKYRLSYQKIKYYFEIKKKIFMLISIHNG